MNISMKCISACIGIGIVTLATAYIGYVDSYFDDETQITFFLKKSPTLQIKFYDPFANEADDVPIDQLKPTDRMRFSIYCRYRYGIVESSDMALRQCKAQVG